MFFKHFDFSHNQEKISSLSKCENRGNYLSHPAIIKILKPYQWGEWRYDGSLVSLKQVYTLIKEEIRDLAIDDIIDLYHWNCVQDISLQNFRRKFSEVFAYDFSTNYLKDPSIIDVLKSYNWMYREVEDNTYPDYDDIINEINNLFLSGFIEIDHLNCIKNRSKRDFFVNFREIFYWDYVFETYLGNPEIYKLIEFFYDKNIGYSSAIYDIDDAKKRDLLNLITETMLKLVIRKICQVYEWQKIENRFECVESASVKRLASIVSEVLLLLKQWKFANLNATQKFSLKIESMVNPLREYGDVEDLTRNDKDDYSLYTCEFSLQVDATLKVLRQWKFLQLMSTREFSLQIWDAIKSLEGKRKRDFEIQALSDAQYYPFGRDK